MIKSFTWFSATLTTVVCESFLQVALQANPEIQMEMMNWRMENTSNIPLIPRSYF